MTFNGRLPKEIPVGTSFTSWVVIREVERGEGKTRNRRFLCRCSACGDEQIKFLSNLVQGKGCRCSVDYVASSRPGRLKAIAARETAAQVSDEGRICLTCGTWKPWAEFYDDRRAARGKASNCIGCAYWGTVKAAFGLTRVEWEFLYNIQGGVCALCGEPEMIKHRMSVDHNHSCCGKTKGCKRCIRGLLCGVCNRVLGHVEAKPELVPRFADYLERRPLLLVVAANAEMRPRS
jgi:hypothetical protein